MKINIVIIFQFIMLTLGIMCASAFAANSLLVWPIYQVIESDENSSALWLENKGGKPVALQIRIMAWKQIDFKDRYAEQKEVIATPPFTTLEPGKRHMIRLIRTTPAPVNSQQSYRLIIDEIAEPYNNAQETPKMGLQFQMRYLLPLFIDGKGIWTQVRPDKKRATRDPTLPDLYWKIAHVSGKPHLYVRNRGIVSARLSNVFWASSQTNNVGKIQINSGFLGYVLPGQAMRWPLPPGVSPPGSALQLFTQLSDIAEPVLIKRE